MPKSDTGLVTHLRVKAEAAIAKAAAARQRPATATLADIERTALSAGREIEQAIAQALADESAAEVPA